MTKIRAKITAQPDKQVPADLSAQQFVKRLKSYRSREEAKKYLRYFISGEGQYGEGDKFMGVLPLQSS